MMRLADAHSNDFIASNPSGPSPEALSRDGFNELDGSGRKTTDFLELASIPTRGVQHRHRWKSGETDGGFGRGYVNLGHRLDIDQTRLKASGQINPDSALGVFNVDYRVSDSFKYQANIRHEQRGSTRDMESNIEDYQLSASMQRARRDIDGECRVIEKQDYRGGVYNGAGVYSQPLPMNQSLQFTSYLEYNWVETSVFRRLTPIHEASAQLASAAKLTNKPGIILKQNVDQSVTNVHRFELGDTVILAKNGERRVGGKVGLWNSYFDVVRINTLRRQVQAECLTSHREHIRDGRPAAGEVLFSSENGSGWRYLFMACFGLQCIRQFTEYDQYREVKKYQDTQEGTRRLNNAETSFYKQAIPQMNVAKFTSQLGYPNTLSDADVQLTGAMRSHETTEHNSVAWKVGLLFGRPGFWTGFSRECNRTSRQELDFRRDGDHPHVVDRFVDTRATSKVFWNRLPTVSEVTALEEWIPSVNGESDSEFHKLRFFSKWQAKAPQTPEQLNAVVAHYNKIFGTELQMLDVSPTAIRTTRHIKLDSEVSEGDIDRLAAHFRRNINVKAVAERMHLKVNTVERLKRDLRRADTTRARSAVLRKFVAQDGVRAIALIHSFGDVGSGTVNLSADMGLYDSAIRYSGAMRTRYVMPIAGPVNLSDVEDRLWDITKALRLIHEARACINQDPVLLDNDRVRQLTRLSAEEEALRALYEPNNDSTRKVIFDKLSERWHMTQQACEFAAVFQKNQDLGKRFEGEIVDQQSAFAFLRHYDEGMQALRRVQAGTGNNILLTAAQRANHAERIANAIDRLEADYNARRRKNCPHARRWLRRPWGTCGFFWFASLRGWRFFWQGLSEHHARARMHFWPTTALLGLTTR